MNNKRKRGLRRDFDKLKISESFWRNYKRAYNRKVGFYAEINIQSPIFPGTKVNGTQDSRSE